MKSIKLPSHLEKIGSLAFEGCSALESISIPNSVYYIGYRAFYGCANLKEFTFPDNPRLQVGGEILFDCSSLYRIVIPNNGGTFEGTITDSPTLKEIVSLNNLPPLKYTSELFRQIVYLNAVLKVRSGSIDNYRNADGWKDFVNIIEEYDEIPMTSLAITFDAPYDSYYKQKMEGTREVMQGNSLIVEMGLFIYENYKYYVPYFNGLRISSSEIYDRNSMYAYYITPPIYSPAVILFRYEKDTSIEDIHQDKKMPFDMKGQSIINSEHNMMSIFSIDGKIIYKGKDEVINIPHHGIFIITVNNNTYKIVF